MTWTREHDRVLAEKCEGKQTIILSGKPYFPPKPCRCQPGWVESDCEAGPATPIPDYSTDLPAVVRAAEAWRKGEDTDARSWSINTYGLDPEKPFRAIAQIWNSSTYSKFPASHSNPATALAQALYQAVTA